VNRSTSAPRDKPVLLTGATGYVGGRLAPRLLEAGYTLRCFVRSPGKLADREWVNDPRVEIVQGDLNEPESIREALRGCGAAYYLVHSMVSAKGDFARRDRDMARHFRDAAAEVGVERIVYLGGLGELGPDLSAHLVSRREVEQELREGDVPVTALRAAMIIGAGSASFEILRYLVERLPVMVTPRWVRTECQPIAIRNVLHYLVACLDEPETIGRTLDIGCPEPLTYRRLMEIYQEQRGLPKRLVIPVPVLTPKLSSLWIHVVTPVDKEIARPLAEGLKNRVVCSNDDAARLMPQRLLSAREAVHAALARTSQNYIETSWSAAGPVPGDPDWAGGDVFVDERSIRIRAGAHDVFRAVCRVGGGHGWYAADWLWRLRGFMDRLIGGPGLRRGRRVPDTLSYGEALDFWRVTEIVPDRRLALRAEMRVPGEAKLLFEIDPHTDAESGDRSCTLTQTALFQPKGLVGLLYWYAVLPFHGVVFSGMQKGIRRAAETLREQSEKQGDSSGRPIPGETPSDHGQEEGRGEAPRGEEPAPREPERVGAESSRDAGRNGTA